MKKTLMITLQKVGVDQSYNINIFVIYKLRIRNLYSYFRMAAQWDRRCQFIQLKVCMLYGETSPIGYAWCFAPCYGTWY